MSRVEFETKDKITRLWLERPEALNAMSEATAKAFEDAIGKVAKEDSLVVILSGRGSAFSAGGDLAFIEANMKRAKSDLKKRMERFYKSFLTIRALPQATIAEINGTAIGAGLCLAFACDLRFARADAKLGFNFVRLGLAPGLAAYPLARAVLGDARARELLLTGKFFTGAELAQWGGAVEALTNPLELSARVEECARQIAAASPLALRWLKAELALGDADIGKHLKAEAEGQAHTFGSEDLAEGVRAVRERRAPKF